MPGFMEGYGLADERRALLIKRLILGGLAILVVGAGSFYYFRTWKEERVIDDFLATVRQGNIERAYTMWCATPCQYYPREKFIEDWGPSTPYANVDNARIRHIDYCDNGVVFNFDWGPAPDVTLWVERADRKISFAPWPRCPGPHLQLTGFLERLFGSSDAK